MYGKQRFLINNRLSGNIISASSQATGRLSGFSTIAAGSASWSNTGNYSGEADLVVTVMIDDVSAGKEIGNAKFSWKTSETTTGWEATGVTTSATPITLQDGIQVFWTAGTGDDFEDGDTGIFWAYASFGVGNLLDLDRNTSWVSTGDSDESLTINFGSSKQVTAFVLADHNLTAGATVTLMGNTSSSWGSPPYTQTLTVADPLVVYLNKTYQYFRLRLQDSSNPDGYLKAAELYLGTYTELAADHARIKWGSTVTRSRRLIENQSETGRRTQRIWSVQRVFDFDFDALDSTDEATLLSIWQSTFDTTTGRVSPLWVHYFQDVTSTMMLCRILNDYSLTYRSYGIYSANMKLEEVAKTR